MYVADKTEKGKERSPTTMIQDLNLTDTNYAALVAKGYAPHLEHQMIEAGTPPRKARKLTRLVGLVKDKPPETDEE